MLDIGGQKELPAFSQISHLSVLSIGPILGKYLEHKLSNPLKMVNRANG